MDELPVVVGYDGSGAADVALGWAAREASSRQLPLDVVVAVPDGTGWRRHADESRHVGSADAEAIGELGRRCAQTWVEPARVRVRVAAGRPAGELVAASRTASLVVVGQGDQDLGPARSMHSTSRVVAARAWCPVVVVRGASGAGRSVLPVVVGVPVGALLPSMLDFAAATASLRAVPLTLLTAWTGPARGVSPGGAGAGGDRPTDLARRLAQRAASSNAASREYVHDHHPGVTTRSLVTHEHPGRALAVASRRAGLVVLGAAPHPASDERALVPLDHLGDVGRDALAHSACPVAVVPTVVSAPDVHHPADVGMPPA